MICRTRTALSGGAFEEFVEAAKKIWPDAKLGESDVYTYLEGLKAKRMPYPDW